MRRMVLCSAALVVVASCAGGDQQSAATLDSSSTEGAIALSEAPIVTITAKDFAFEMPDTIAGGLTTIRLVNQGPELHHVQLIKLGEGKTFADYTAALKEMKAGTPPPTWMGDVAGPNSPMPGGETRLTEVLEPGHYAVVCFIDTPDKVPHFVKGMVHSLVVTPGNPSATVATPTADVEVTMSDYAWSVTPAITAGKHVIKLMNTAAQAHEMFIAKLEPGKTVGDLMKWAESYKEPMPATAMGGITAMPSGAVAYLAVDLPVGDYVLLCFIPDAKDGKPHVAHGMVQTLKVS